MTMTLTIRAKSPMNMGIHKMLKQNVEIKCIEVEHAHMNIYRAQMQIFIIRSGNNTHSYKHSFNMFIMIINRKYGCRSKMNKITYLMKKLFRNQLSRCNVPPNHSPACSLISQQRCHPQAGHDSSGIRVNCRLTHSQGETFSSQT